MNTIKQRLQIISRWISSKAKSDRIVFSIDGYYNVTFREICVSFIIMMVMSFFGIIIADKIHDIEDKKIIQYQQSIQTDNTDIFKYTLETKPGGCFAFGEYHTIDPIEFEGNKYCYFSVDYEEYREHTEVTTHNIYWQWDTVGGEDYHSNMINFLGVDIPYEKIDKTGINYIDTIDTSYHRRSVYYGSPADSVGTIWVNTVEENPYFYFNQGENLEETVKSYIRNGRIGYYVFIVCWILLCSGCIIAFWICDNTWLTRSDNKKVNFLEDID